jgi:hypothetical protein
MGKQLVNFITCGCEASVLNLRGRRIATVTQSFISFHTKKTDRHDITETLLKVALNTIKQSLNLISFHLCICSVVDVYIGPLTMTHIFLLLNDRAKHIYRLSLSNFIFHGSLSVNITTNTPVA